MGWYRYWARPRFHVEPPDVAGQDDASTPEDAGASAFHADHQTPPPMFHVEHADDPEQGDARTPAVAAGPQHAERPQKPTRPGAGAVPPPPVASVTQVSARSRGAATGQREARVLVVANQKGGVGKTTTAVNVARALAAAGKEALLVDLDPQCNASSGLGQRPGDGQSTVYDVLVKDSPAEAAIVPTSAPRLWLLPSTIALAGAEVELVTAFSREHKLARALARVRDRYDIIIVDCPPSLGLLTVNALTAGTEVLVPIQCEYYALEGLQSLLQNVELIRANLNPDLDTVGYLMTMHDGRTRLSEQVVDEVRRFFGSKVFETRVPRSVRLAEAPSYGQSILDFDPSSRGAIAYHRVAGELLARMDGLDRPTRERTA